LSEKGKGTRKIVVREQKEIHRGTNRRGHDYVIYQLIATTEGGVAIDQNLRSFQKLPLNQLIEVTIERFESTNFGVSYTVSTKAKGADAVGQRISGLERQVEELAKRLAAVESSVRQNGAAPQPGSQSPAATPPPQTPAPQPAGGLGGQMPTDDIPF
jgi:hypothetical protein